MSTYAESYPDEELDDDISYRAISRPALIAPVLGVVSLIGLMFPVMLALAGVAMLLAVKGLISISRYPQELSGRIPAVLGILISSAVLVGGTMMHSYVYMTEVPDGFERVSFYDLQPDTKDPLQIVPQRAVDLNNQKVFIKGYIHPGVSGLGPVDSFVLVRDMGTCCFGGQPKLQDMIEVRLEGGLRARYSTRRRKLAGVFSVSPPSGQQAAGGLSGGIYHLHAVQIK